MLLSSAAGGAYWPIAIRCPFLGPFPSWGGVMQGHTLRRPRPTSETTKQLNNRRVYAHFSHCIYTSTGAGSGVLPCSITHTGMPLYPRMLGHKGICHTAAGHATTCGVAFLAANGCNCLTCGVCGNHTVVPLLSKAYPYD